jgi:hypothetical protein
MRRTVWLVSTRDWHCIVHLLAGSSTEMILLLFSRHFCHKRTALFLFGHWRRRRTRSLSARSFHWREASLCHFWCCSLHADWRSLKLERFGWGLLSCVDILSVALLGRWPVNVGVNRRLVAAIAWAERTCEPRGVGCRLRAQLSKVHVRTSPVADSHGLA